MLPRIVALVPVFVLSLAAGIGRAEAGNLTLSSVQGGPAAISALVDLPQGPAFVAALHLVPAPKH